MYSRGYYYHHHDYGGGDYFGQQHGLGLLPLVGEAAPGVVGFLKALPGKLFGGRARAGGLDPCCPDPHPSGFKAGSESRAWPRNSSADGRVPGGIPGARTPPDFRLLSPIARKDDACDCIPVIHNGRGWVIGTVSQTATGLDFIPASEMRDPQNARWIDVATLRTATVTAARAEDAPPERVPTGPVPGLPTPGPVTPFQAAGIVGGPMMIAMIGVALGLMLMGGKKRRR